MLEIITSLVVIMNASAVGLGVGSSTLAITSFLTALTDGTVDESERRMLGVIYVVLRIAMALILLTTLFIAFVKPDLFGSSLVYLWILISVLFINAVLMTKHWISMKIGPAIQAGTWYTLGFINTIQVFGLFETTLSGFFIIYAIDIAFAVVILNAYLKFRKKPH